MSIIKPTQELGETRTAMGWHVMNSLDKIINENRKFEVDNIEDKLLFHCALSPDIPQEDIAYQQDENIVPETAEAAKESGAMILY